MLRWFGKNWPNMGVAVPQGPVGTRSPEALKSLVMGPSLLVNCYLEIKFHKKIRVNPPPPLNNNILNWNLTSWTTSDESKCQHCDYVDNYIQVWSQFITLNAPTLLVTFEHTWNADTGAKGALGMR